MNTSFRYCSTYWLQACVLTRVRSSCSACSTPCSPASTAAALHGCCSSQPGSRSAAEHRTLRLRPPRQPERDRNEKRTCRVSYCCFVYFSGTTRAKR